MLLMFTGRWRRVKQWGRARWWFPRPPPSPGKFAPNFTHPNPQVKGEADPQYGTSHRRAQKKNLKVERRKKVLRTNTFCNVSRYLQQDKVEKKTEQIQSPGENPFPQTLLGYLELLCEGTQSGRRQGVSALAWRPEAAKGEGGRRVWRVQPRRKNGHGSWRNGGGGGDCRR